MTGSAFEAVQGAAGPAGPAGGLFDAYAYLRDEKANDAQSGTFTSGAWRTRDLTTEVFDSDAFVSLASNQFTLQAGTYFIVARAPGFVVNSHTTKIRNVTDSTDVIIGSTSHCTVSFQQTDSWVHGRVTIASAKAFEIQHWCQTTRADNGFGVVGESGEVEVYAEVWIYREAA